MKNYIRSITALIFTAFTFNVSAQKYDTLIITQKNLVAKNIILGKHTYVVYNKKTKESPATGIYLVKMNIESKIYKGKPVIAITQQWDRDTVVHSAYTILDAANFSTIQHNWYWKRLGYSENFDFESRHVSFEGNVPDSVKTQSIENFNESFNKYNLNWHSDLVVFTVLPYKQNRAFKINFFDPGFGKPSEEVYSVTGSDFLIGSSGEKIECWILEIKLTSSVVGYQKFWVAKKRPEVLKEEDFYNGGYRYKLKLEVSENN